MEAGKENRVGKLKVETFSLLISILIHLGLLMASFSLSPPESTKYIRSIRVDYIISLPKTSHHLRESPGKSIISSLSLPSQRENTELLKPFSTLTKKPSISSNLRSQERILSPEGTSTSRKRESPSLFSPPIKVGVPIPESNSLREGTSKMVSNIPEVDTSIDKATIFSSFSPLTRTEKSPLIRKIDGSGYFFREESLSQKRLADHNASLATKPVALNQTLALRQREKTPAFVGSSSFQEKKSEPLPAPHLPNPLLLKIKKPPVKTGLDLLNLEEKMPKQNKILYQRSELISVAQGHSPKKRTKWTPLSSIPSFTPTPLTPISLPARNFNYFPMRQKELSLLPAEKSSPHPETRITEEGGSPKIIISTTSRIFPYKKATLREPNPLGGISPGEAREKVRPEILPSSLDPIVQPGTRGYPPTINETKFSPLSIEPDFRQEEIRVLKGDTELLTELLQLREYAEKIRELINANKKYPPIARQRGWEGRIKVRFMINSSGRVTKTEVLSPSSYEVLNRAAEKLIKDISPFPSFPSSWHKNSLTIELQIVYQLKEST